MFTAPRGLGLHGQEHISMPQCKKSDGASAGSCPARSTHRKALRVFYPAVDAVVDEHDLRRA